MLYGVLILNFFLTYLVTCGIYDPIVGVVYTAISIAITMTMANKKEGITIFCLLIKKRSPLLDNSQEEGRKVMLSCGFLGLGVRLSVLYGAFLFAGGTIIMFIALVLAFGLLFEGKLSDFIGAFYLAKIITKVGMFLLSWTDPIINFIIDKEFKILKIETV